MTDQDDFQARAKRVRTRLSNRHDTQPGPRQQQRSKEFDEEALIGAILRSQLAALVGATMLIVGRAIAMNYLEIEPSTSLLGFGEGAIVAILLIIVGLLFGRSDRMSHGALIVGAALAFLCEGYYIPVFSEMMEQIYTQGYVALVVLGGQ